MQINKMLFLAISLLFFSCNDKKETKAIIYKNGNVIKEFYGVFFSTKYGGLNYYVSEKKYRNDLINIKDIDSIVFEINNKLYTAEPLIMKSFSRERNDSDFSFSITEKEHNIIVDKIKNMETISIFSERTDLEELKDKKIIEYTFLED